MTTTFDLNSTTIFLSNIEAVKKNSQQIQYNGQLITLASKDMFNELLTTLKDYHIHKATLTSNDYNKHVVDDLNVFINIVKKEIQQSAKDAAVTAIKDTVGKQVHELDNLTITFRELMNNIALQFDEVNDGLEMSTSNLHKTLTLNDSMSNKLEKEVKNMTKTSDKITDVLKVLEVLVEE